LVFVGSKATQTKEQSYQHCHWRNFFIFLSIKSFGCLQNQVDDFLQLYAKNVWGMKGLNNPLLSS
jgi:glutaminase